MIGEVIRNVGLTISVATTPNADVAKNPQIRNLTQLPSPISELVRETQAPTRSPLCLEGNTVFIPDRSSEASPTSTEKPLAEENPILAEARKLGIKESEYEKGLWNLDPLRSELTREEWRSLDFETMAPFSRDVVIFTIDNMLYSENSCFNHASIFLMESAQEGRATLDPVDDPNVGIAAFYGLTEDHKPIINIIFNPRIILSSRPIDIAYGITRISKTGELLPENLEDGGLTPEEQLAESAATETQAYIIQAGLQGEEIGSLELEDSPDVFIANGSNPRNPVWIEYVVNEYQLYEPQI